MKSGVPWSVKGVEPDAREAAKAKARRAGLTLGAWLNQVIRESGGVELPDAEIQRWVGDDEPEAPAFPELNEISGRIETLERRQIEANREIEQALETLAVRIGRSGARPAEPDRTLIERLAKLETEGQKRFERLSREMGMLANRYGDIEARHEQGHQELTEALERQARRAPAAGGSDSAALAKIQSALGGMEGRLESVSRDARSAASTFEHALKAVMERVVGGERRQQEQSRSYERALEALAGRVQEAVEREGPNEAEAVRALEHAVGEITEHFETIEKRRERASRAVEDAIKGLTERLAESDRRNSEQVLAPLAGLDRTIQRMTQRLEEQDGRTQASVATLEKRLQDTDARSQSTLTAVSKRLHESDSRLEDTVATIHGQFENAGGRMQDALAQIEARLHGQDQQAQDGLAAIDNRLSDIAERIDLNDTETKASRLALLRAIDETRRRVATLEDRPYFVAEQPSAPHEPEPEPETASDFASYVTADEPAEIDEPAEPEAEPEEPARGTVYDLIEEVGNEPPAGRDGRAEEPPPYRTSEPVWALLAAARAAARAEAAQAAVETPDDGSALDLSPNKFEEGYRDSSGRRSAGRARRGWARPLLISAFLLAAIGFSAWQLTTTPAFDEQGRPSFLRSLLDSFNGAMSPKPHGEAESQMPVHVAQGTPAPVLPQGKSVAERAVIAVPAAPEPAALKSNPLATAKLEAPGATPAPQATGDAGASAKAIAGVRAAQSDQERADAAAALIKAAETGNAEAEFTLGRVYETGRGVKTDLAAARDWYSKAADQGHVAAAFNLGMLEAQSGTREGYGHAARWFDQAARHGLADAQFNLGMLYAQGLGIGRDPVEAFAWFSAAAAQGDAGAAAERDRIGQALDDAARARGEALARERSTQPKTNRG